MPTHHRQLPSCRKCGNRSANRSDIRERLVAPLTFEGLALFEWGPVPSQALGSREIEANQQFFEMAHGLAHRLTFKRPFQNINLGAK